MKGFSGRVLRLAADRRRHAGAAAAPRTRCRRTRAPRPRSTRARARWACSGSSTSPSDCRHGESAISWNVQGPKGDPGPAGGRRVPKGDTGQGRRDRRAGAAGPTRARPVPTGADRRRPAADGRRRSRRSRRARRADRGAARAPQGRRDRRAAGARGRRARRARRDLGSRLARSAATRTRPCEGHGETCTLGEVILSAGAVDERDARERPAPADQPEPGALLAVRDDLRRERGDDVRDPRPARATRRTGSRTRSAIEGIFPSRN